MEMDTPSPVADTTAPVDNDSVDINTVEFESTTLPETYKESAVGKYKTVGEVIKGYNEAQKLIGAKGVIVPGDNAKPEDIDKFYNALGRPEKADGYKLDQIDNVHEKIRGNTDIEKNFRAMAHKLGLTQKQASAMYKDYVGGVSQGLTKSDADERAATEKASADLHQEWGADYDTNIARITKNIGKFGPDGAVEHYGKEGYGRDPIVLKTLANMTKNFAEDSFVKGDNLVPAGVSDAQKKLKDIMDDKAHPYWVSGKGHDEAVIEVRRLQEIITPNERKPRE